MDWKKLFSSGTLDKGHDYYNEGFVDELRLEKDTLTATVQGTDEYNVRIRLKNGSISGMFCSCPYAEDGNNCKHMAAVLYQWEEDKNDDGLKEGDTKNDSAAENNVASLVISADSDLVKKFLTQILIDDDKLWLRFKSMVVSGVSAEDMKKYKDHVNKIVRKYSGRHDYIDYSTAYDFTREISEFLVDIVSIMTDNKNYREAFELTNHVFLTIADVEMDDSDGGSGEIASQCFDIWVDILNNVDAQDKASMFSWFTDHLDGSVIDYMEEHIETIIMNEFEEPDFIGAKLAFVDKKVLASQVKSNSWGNRYEHGKWALYRLSLMESSLSNWNDLEKYCIEHWASSNVRKYYVDKCLEKQNFKRAIEVLDESIILDAEHRGLVSAYCMKLKNLYKQTGDSERYLEQLWRLTLEYKIGDLEIYRELKAIYNEAEWIEQREKIFQTLSQCQQNYIYDYYIVEKLYDRLLEAVLRSRGLSYVNKYLAYLKNIYPRQLLKKYSDELESMTDCTSNRKHYQEMVSNLRIMKSLEGGQEIVSEITRNWRLRYGNRPAMMDELRKL